MSKDYQKKVAGTSTAGQVPVCVVPDVVSVAMGEIAGRSGMLALQGPAIG